MSLRSLSGDSSKVFFFFLFFRLLDCCRCLILNREGCVLLPSLIGIQILWHSPRREGFLNMKEEGGMNRYEKAKLGMKTAAVC